MNLNINCTHPNQNQLTPCFKKDNNLKACIILAFTTCLIAFPCLTSAETDNGSFRIEMSQSLEKGLLSGKPEWLNDNTAKFFAVYDVDQSGQPKGAVIILHDADSHPDKPEIIRPLRSNLPMHGWATISVQLPYLASITDYSNKQSIINQRINSAANYLQSNGINNIVLLGHGTGAMAATAYLSAQHDAPIQAFIAISLGILDQNEKPESISQQLEKITVPILDIFGSNDLDHITNTARSRALAARISSNAVTSSKQIGSYKRSAIAVSSAQKFQGYISYRQIVIKGASHDFSGTTRLLTKRITGWLERHAKGIMIDTAQ